MPSCAARPASADDSGRRDARANRQTLLDVSAQVLAEDPLASMDEIASRAGLGRATVYRHVAGRAELVHEVAAAALQTAAQAVRDAAPAEGSAPDALRRVLSALVREGGRHRALLLLGVTRDPVFLAARALVFAPIVELVQRGVAAGELRADLDPQWALTSLLALLQAAVAEGRDDPAEVVWITLIRGWGSADDLK
jgi:AcrR family transcriptional regulator